MSEQYCNKCFDLQESTFGIPIIPLPNLSFPHQIVIDLGEDKISHMGFSYLPRAGSW